MAATGGTAVTETRRRRLTNPRLANPPTSIDHFSGARPWMTVFQPTVYGPSLF
jgi:hypothetical protein